MRTRICGSRQQVPTKTLSLVATEKPAWGRRRRGRTQASATEAHTGPDDGTPKSEAPLSKPASTSREARADRL